MQYAFEELHLQRCFAGTNPDNAPMQGLFNKFGIKRVSDKPREDSGHLWLDYAVYESEWPEVKVKMQEALEQKK